MGAILKSDGTVEIVRDIVQPGDPRLSDSRAPEAHGTTHADGGVDEIVTALDPRAYPCKQDTLANRPAATIGNAGRLFYASDFKALFINNGGGTWDEIARGFTFAQQAADVGPETAAAMTDTDLAFDYLAAAIYVVDFFLLIRSGAGTTGLKLAWDVNSAVTSAALQFEHVLANTGTLTGGDAIADDTARGISSGVAATGVDIPVVGRGQIVTALNTGTAKLRFASEVAGPAGVTFRAKSSMRVMRVA